LEENRTVVYRFLLASVGPHEVDDCFQETFLSALKAYPRLRDGDHLRAWVLTIASRKAIDAGRGRARRAIPTGGAEELGDPPVLPEPPGIDVSDPVWGAVRALPPKQRTAVVMRHVLDRPYAEIAEVTGTSAQAARANVSQAVRTLRSTLPRKEEA
jgi:RNA polymerase sigma factor (sigma-70 family)